MEKFKLRERIFLVGIRFLFLCLCFLQDQTEPDRVARLWTCTPFDDYLLAALHNNLDSYDAPSSHSPQTNTYVRDAKGMASTPADVIDNPTSYSFVIDMPGLNVGDIKVQVEDDNLLVISGYRRREREGEDNAKYLRMERRIGKFMRKFALPENADKDKVTASCRDGVLTVTVPKLPPPQPKKPRTIEVKVA